MVTMQSSQWLPMSVVPGTIVSVPLVMVYWLQVDVGDGVGVGVNVADAVAVAVDVGEGEAVAVAVGVGDGAVWQNTSVVIVGRPVLS
jgi:hypothetical protein